MPIDELKVYNIPSKCSKCGNVYLTDLKLAGKFIKYGMPGSVAEDGTVLPPVPFNKITLQGDFPCTTCYARNKPDIELLRIIQDAIDVFNKLKIEDLLSLQQKLRLGNGSNFSIDDFVEAKKAIESAAPELKSVKDLIPKTRMEAYTIITLILSVIGVCISLLGLENSKEPTVYQVIEINQKSFKNYLPDNSPFYKPASLNSQCPCGSGKKFKRCHGKSS